jgi:ADP-heptose:LPS heptosyltransferase
MKILINRSDAIGDTILTTPMAKMLKEKFPNCHITFLISSRSADILEKHPYIDDFKIYHRKSRFYFKIKEIISIFNDVKPTHYFYVGGGYLPNFVAWLYRISFRGGLRSRWHTYLFLNHGIRQKRSMVSMHEMEFNLNLLSPLGIKYHYSDLDRYVPELKISEDESNKNFSQFLESIKGNKLDPSKKLIFIHPGMTGHTLNWSSRNYGRFIIKMNQKFPNKFNYIISYTPSDERFLFGLRDILGRNENKYLTENVYFFNGAILGLRHYMSVLKNAQLFIGPSTGTTHIASALGVPLVGIYSPIKVQSTKRWGPLTTHREKQKVAVPDVICGESIKCSLKECPYYECMAKIEVEDVIKLAVTVMEK